MVSKSLPKSSELQQVLSRLNDDFMHPNPDFTYRDISIKNCGSALSLEIQFFDVIPEIHEGHLLAYLNLLDIILSESERLVSGLFNISTQEQPVRYPFAITTLSRATKLAGQNAVAKKVMEELGLWQF